MTAPTNQGSKAAEGSSYPEPLLATCIATLQPSARAVSACKQLGVVTISDFLDHPQEDFLKLSGCGQRTFDDLCRVVQAFLDAGTQAEGKGLTPLHERKLNKLVRNPRAQKAFLKLGLKTVGDFLATPKEELLKVPGFGERTWQQVMARVQSVAVQGSQTADVDLLPTCLLHLPLTGLGLPAATLGGFQDLGCSHLADILYLAADRWPVLQAEREATRTLIRGALDNLLKVGLDQISSLPNETAVDYPTLHGRLIAPLGSRQRAYLERRIGLTGNPATAPEIACQEGVAIDDVHALEAEVREQLLQRAPSILSRLAEEAEAELLAFEGAVQADHLAQGTMLHTIARGTEDPLVPMRLLTICYPDRFHLHQGVLTDMAPGVFRRFLQVLRVHIQPQNLPLKFEDLVAELAHVVEPVPQGLLTLMLKDIWHLTLQIDPRRGEVITWSRNSVAARLRDVLREVRRPVRMTDLVFHYRERFRRARKDRIHAHLGEDPTFLQVGNDLWSLREWHLDELELAREEAARLAEQIAESGQACELADVMPGERARSGDRSYWLVLHVLKQSSKVKYLGLGRFRPANMEYSLVMSGILKDFKKAMGEVPRSRFLYNTDPAKHRLVARLLRDNRAFVLVDVDRIDVITNYPFNRERMQRLLALVDTELGRAGGYAHVEDLLEAVNETDLGGSWLRPLMLEDLLRRHGHYDHLAGGLIAQEDLELGTWIQARARQALRMANIPLTLSEVQAEAPELSEFREVLGELLDRDPMVQTEDGLRYQVA